MWASDTAADSTLVAGGDLTLVATGAGEQSDITLQGTQATAARNLTLTAEDEIRLLAAKSTAEQQSSNKSSSASVGVSVGTSGPLMFNVGASAGRGKADGHDVTWTNTRVEAGGTLALRSGGDTTLKGAVAQGERVIADIGGDLAIESLQDTSDYKSKQQSAGFTLSIGAGQVGGSLSASQAKAKSDYASVAEQSAFRAGDSGFQVAVAGDTDLQGGAITSTQAAVDAGKNRFETGGELTLSDLHNRAEYSASSASVSVGAGVSFDGKLTPQGSSAGLGQDADQAQSTTLAAISGLAGNTAARTGDAETGIAPIFDQQKVQKEIEAQTKITQLFGQLALKAAADFAKGRADDLKAQAGQESDADKRAALEAEAKQWDEGGAYRVALHTAVGGLAGGAQGALGAGAVASAAPFLDDLQQAVTDALQKAGVGDTVAKTAGQLVSGATAAGLGAAASGGSSVGTAMGFNVDVNNRQLHPDQVALVKRKARSLSNHVNLI